MTYQDFGWLKEEIISYMDRLNKRSYEHITDYYGFLKNEMALENYILFYKHVFEVTNAKDKTVFECGCGAGVGMLLMKLFGAKCVIGLDLVELKIDVAIDLLMNADMNEVYLCRGDATNIPLKNECIEVVIAIEAISHFREKEIFLQEARRVLTRRGLLYINDGNNALNPMMRRTNKQIWNDSEKVWVGIRKRMISDWFPSLDSRTIDFLATETAGMYGEQIKVAVDEWNKTGVIRNKPSFKYRSPTDGYFAEFLFNPYKLCKEITSYGFNTTVSPFKHPSISKRKLGLNKRLKRLTKGIIFAFPPPISYITASAFEIIAIKR